MNFAHKVRRGLHLIRATPGLRGKLHATRQLTQAALKTKYGKRQDTPEAEVSANAWADYHILRFASRNVNVRLRADQARRMWLIIPELDPKMIFGGYIALLQFAKFMQGRGIPVGFISLNPIPARSALLESFEDNELAHGVLSQAEFRALGVGRTVELNPADMLVSYNWTTTLIASKMARFLDDPAPYYFVQEDERIFYPNDSYRFLCESAFRQEPRPRLICNSAKLAEYFVAHGLAQESDIAGVFEQGLPPAEIADRETLSQRSPRRFGFYGRPEDHAKRNLMQVALLAIAKAKREGAFDQEPWEFYMVGSSRMGESFDLEGTKVTCLPNQGYDAYRQTLAGFDAGICLMYAPHPSVPPFEMIRSGVVTVVNTTRERTSEWYRGISGNFEPAAPTIEDLASAITRAVQRVGDVEARLSNAHSYHPETWEESLAHLPQALGHSIFQIAEKDRIRD